MHVVYSRVASLLLATRTMKRLSSFWFVTRGSLMLPPLLCAGGGGGSGVAVYFIRPNFYPSPRIFCNLSAVRIFYQLSVKPLAIHGKVRGNSDRITNNVSRKVSETLSCNSVASQRR